MTVHFPKAMLTAALGVAALAAASCSVGPEGFTDPATRTLAADQIMLVRGEPPSFGFRRLVSQQQVYPDLAFFVSKSGVPDFLAETNEQGRRYFILYYLEKRQAFACRTKSGTKHEVEFAGPYPVTDREFRLLSAFRKDPTRLPPTT